MVTNWFVCLWKLLFYFGFLGFFFIGSEAIEILQPYQDMTTKGEFTGTNDIYSTTIELDWSGASICMNKTCTHGDTFPTDHYACTMPGYGSWNNGAQDFMDPIPPGNALKYVNITLVGRFNCDPSQPKATFLATIEDSLVAYGRLPSDPVGCNCSRCVTSASFVSDSSFNDWSSYKYQRQNTFQMGLVINDICLSSTIITFFYTPINITIESVSPNVGSLDGGTAVNVTLRGYNTSSWCQFGEDSMPVPATMIAPGVVNCTTPPVSSPRTVNILVSVNGAFYFNSNVTFIYYEAPIPTPLTVVNLLKQYWWILLIGALVIIAVLVVFGISIRRQPNQDPATSPLLQSGNLLTYSDLEGGGSIGLGDIVLGERIGRGNFGEVFKGHWHGTVVAVKKTKLPSVATKEELAEFLDDFEREAQIMRTIRHPNVLQFLGVCKLGGQEEICIITEYMPRGSLHKILHDASTVLDWPLRLRMGVDVSRGMNYLHKSNPVIIHRDLKSHNLLLDEHFKVKISDFGLAKLLNAQSDSSMTSCGTPAWTAPEVLRNERYTEKADLFSFGIVLWELVTREEPHHGVPPFQIVFAVGTQGIRPTVPSSCPQEIATLIEDCWAESPEERPDFGEVMKKLEAAAVSQ